MSAFGAVTVLLNIASRLGAQIYPRPFWRRSCLVLLTLLAGAAAVAPTSAPAGVVLGVYTRNLYDNSALAMSELRDQLGMTPQIAMYYQDWNPDPQTALINPAIVLPLVRQGVVPMITWEPTASSDNNAVDQGGYSLSRIARGAYDAYLRRAAREAVHYRRSLFIRLAPEMNGKWDSWGARPGNSPSGYVAMWRHVVSIFRAVGASNVRWVWSPNVFAAGSTNTESFVRYYPGDAWVYDVGLDGYNWGLVHKSSWMTFGQVFQSSYDAMTRLTSRPLMITETASTELGGSKAAWISEIPRTLSTGMPRVHALVWFDVEKETDWSFASSPSSLSAFRELVGSGAFTGSVLELLNPPMLGKKASDVSRSLLVDGRSHLSRRARTPWPAPLEPAPTSLKRDS